MLPSAHVAHGAAKNTAFAMTLESRLSRSIVVFSQMRRTALADSGDREMGIPAALILTTTIYKLACLCVGCLFCTLGYRLFRSGIWGSAGDMDAKFRDLHLVLRSGAPGTFFAVLGAAIVTATVWQGLRYDWQDLHGTTSSPPALPEPPAGNGVVK